MNIRPVQRQPGEGVCFLLFFDFIEVVLHLF